jgi:hypothetical protein
MNNISSLQPLAQTGRASSAEVLAQLACQANLLAKELAGPARAKAYRIKDHAINALILLGLVRVNGAAANGVLGLDILCGSGYRLHVPRAALSSEAKAVIEDEAAYAHVVTSLSDYLPDTHLFRTRLRNSHHGVKAAA